jgi:hypothetical protein
MAGLTRRYGVGPSPTLRDLAIRSGPLDSPFVRIAIRCLGIEHVVITAEIGPIRSARASAQVVQRNVPIACVPASR